MTVSLFTDRARSDARTKLAGESSFAFYDRVDSPFFAALRDELSRWFARYPPSEQNDLRRRLYDVDQGEAALWELIVHELHRAAGHPVEVHPEIGGTSHRPDFLVTAGEERFLVEARVVTATTDARRRRDRRLETLIESINRRARPHAFYTRMELVAEGEQQPPTTELVRDVEAWLAEVDRSVSPDTLLRARSFEDLPRREFSAADWTLRFFAIPVKAELRGRLKGPLIGFGPIEGGVSEPAATIRKALSRKGSRYGTDVPHPLIIALAIEELGADADEDVATALFGGSRRVIARGGSGYWNGRRGAGARVSGVLAIDHPRPWMLPRARPRLWLNPWANRPLATTAPWATATVDLETGALRMREAEVSVAELLGLAEDWPPGEPFPR